MNLLEQWVPARQAHHAAPSPLREVQARAELEMFYRLTVDEAVVQLAQLLIPRA